MHARRDVRNRVPPVALCYLRPRPVPRVLAPGPPPKSAQTVLMCQLWACFLGDHPAWAGRGQRWFERTGIVGGPANGRRNCKRDRHGVGECGPTCQRACGRCEHPAGSAPGHGDRGGHAVAAAACPACPGHAVAPLRAGTRDGERARGRAGIVAVVGDVAAPAPDAVHQQQHRRVDAGVTQPRFFLQLLASSADGAVSERVAPNSRHPASRHHAPAAPAHRPRVGNARSARVGRLL